MQFRDRNIAPSISLLDALKKMDSIDKKLLIIIDEGIFVGLLSIGDIQRAILQNKPLGTVVTQVIRDNVKVGRIGDSIDKLKALMLEFRMEFCPVIDKDNKIINIIFWEDFFDNQKQKPQKNFDIPVVIMAGGLGSRLKPITNVLPKPLIPIGDKTILEEIISRFQVHGCNSYYVSVNYKGELIKYYIENQKIGSDIKFFTEDKPLGTAGSLSLLKDKIISTFFVTNCDILINQDYSEILEYHTANENEITLVVALKHYEIPYGTVEIGPGGELLEIREKPQFNYLINAGMYILEPHLLSEIPTDSFYHITSLIEKLKNQKRKVGVFPVSEGSWMDIGQWDEYNKTSRRLGFEGFNI